MWPSTNTRSANVARLHHDFTEPDGSELSAIATGSIAFAWTDKPNRARLCEQTQTADGQIRVYSGDVSALAFARRGVWGARGDESDTRYIRRFSAALYHLFICSWKGHPPPPVPEPYSSDRHPYTDITPNPNAAALTVGTRAQPSCRNAAPPLCLTTSRPSSGSHPSPGSRMRRASGKTFSKLTLTCR